MADDDATGENLNDRITRQGEDALGKLAHDLLENPLVTGAISRAFTVEGRTILYASVCRSFTLSPFGETTSTGSSGAWTP